MMLKVLLILVLAVVAVALLTLGVAAFFTIGWNMFAPAIGLPAIDLSAGLGAVILLIVARVTLVGSVKTSSATTVVEKAPALRRSAKAS
jgi:hypothetical protein